jgi:hypothetical protein
MRGVPAEVLSPGRRDQSDRDFSGASDRPDRNIPTLLQKKYIGNLRCRIATAAASRIESYLR